MRFFVKMDSHIADRRYLQIWNCLLPAENLGALDKLFRTRTYKFSQL